MDKLTPELREYDSDELHKRYNQIMNLYKVINADNRNLIESTIKFEMNKLYVCVVEHLLFNYNFSSNIICDIHNLIT